MRKGHTTCDLNHQSLFEAEVRAKEALPAEKMPKLLTSELAQNLHGISSLTLLAVIVTENRQWALGDLRYLRQVEWALHKHSQAQNVAYIVLVCSVAFLPACLFAMKCTSCELIPNPAGWPFCSAFHLVYAVAFLKVPAKSYVNETSNCLLPKILFTGPALATQRPHQGCLSKLFPGKNLAFRAHTHMKASLVVRPK